MQQIPKSIQTGVVIAATLAFGALIGGLAVGRPAPVTTTPAVPASTDSMSYPPMDSGTQAFVAGGYDFAPKAGSPLPDDQGVAQLKGKLMPSVESLRDSLSLPPLPEGCTDLRMNEFFEKPGDFGMDYTAKAKSLDGKKVRLLGFMVNRCAHSPGMFLLTSIPVTTHEHEMGLADDLPIATVHVFMPQSPTSEGDTPRTRRLGVVPASHKYGELLPGAVPWTPGLLLLTGTLRTGTREEADGRVSVARLELDALTEGSPVRWGRGSEQQDQTVGGASKRIDSTKDLAIPLPNG